jgi:hypothetical protein
VHGHGSWRSWDCSTVEALKFLVRTGNRVCATVFAFAGGPDALPQGGFPCATCGQLFSQPGSLRAAGNEHFDSSDITELEAELVLALVEEARLAEPGRA